MTPLHLEILMHYFVSGTMFPRSTPTITEYQGHLVELGLLDTELSVTEKGKLWIERVLNTPMPVQKWVWEDKL